MSLSLHDVGSLPTRKFFDPNTPIYKANVASLEKPPQSSLRAFLKHFSVKISTITLEDFSSLPDRQYYGTTPRDGHPVYTPPIRNLDQNFLGPWEVYEIECSPDSSVSDLSCAVSQYGWQTSDTLPREELNSLPDRSYHGNNPNAPTYSANTKALDSSRTVPADYLYSKMQNEVGVSAMKVVNTTAENIPPRLPDRTYTQSSVHNSITLEDLPSSLPDRGYTEPSSTHKPPVYKADTSALDSGLTYSQAERAFDNSRGEKDYLTMETFQRACGLLGLNTIDYVRGFRILDSNLDNKLHFKEFLQILIQKPT